MSTYLCRILQVAAIVSVGCQIAGAATAQSKLTQNEHAKLLAHLELVVNGKEANWVCDKYDNGKHSGSLIDIKYGPAKQGDKAKDSNVVLKKAPAPHCCGATFSAFCEAYQNATGRKDGNWIPGVGVDAFKKAQQKWYVAGTDRTGCAGALIDLGLAEQVSDLNKLEKYDFLQIWWKTGGDNGHSVIVTDVKKDRAGKVTSIEYWSANMKTATSSAGFGKRGTIPMTGWLQKKEGDQTLPVFHAARLKASDKPGK